MSEDVSKGTGIGFGFCIGIVSFIIIVLLGGAILLGGCASYIANNTDNNSESNQEETQQAITKSKPEKPKKWTNIITLSGSTNKTSQIFNLGDGEKRIIYTFKGDPQWLTATISVENTKGWWYGEEEISIDKPISDSSYLDLKAGKYRLKVDYIANCYSWTVTIQEKK